MWSPENEVAYLRARIKFLETEVETLTQQLIQECTKNKHLKVDIAILQDLIGRMKSTSEKESTP